MKKNQKSLPVGRQGFTLIEISVSIVLISVLSYAIFNLLDAVRKSQLTVWQSYINVDEANTNVATLVREIRTARNSDSGTYIFEELSDNQIVFFSDVDFDGNAERVRYFLAGTVFSKGLTEPVGQPATYPSDSETIKVLTENIRNGPEAVFYYFNEDWPEDTANNPLISSQRLSDTRLIRVYLRLNAKDNQPDKDYVLESYTQTRILKDNL